MLLREANEKTASGALTDLPARVNAATIPVLVVTSD